MGENICVVCGRRPATGYVCHLDQQRIDEKLRGIPGQVQRLAVAMVPAGAATGPGERVSISRTGSPPPARLDVLDLIGPGSDRVAAAAMAGLMNPHVRRWRTTEQFTASNGRQVEIITWHQELTDEHTVRYSNSRDLDPVAITPGRPVKLGHDDQVGLVPPAAWAHSWARRWQQRFGHSPRQLRHAPVREQPERPDAQARTVAASTMLGIRGRVPATERPNDPLDHVLEQRFGPRERGYALDTDIWYLREWLPAAVDHDLEWAVFASQLRALGEELTRVLGERPDQQWLGRCPTVLTDHTGIRRACGAGLWQDPYASQITCVRCRSTWGPDKAEVLRLAVTIRKAWPLDRRRRYPRHEIDQLILNPVPCPGCGAGLCIAWHEVTARGDRERWWKPVKAVCPDGCDTGRVL